ncbi:LacI family transcriptional regulator [Chitinophaga lutea]|uniref:LacI family transcriptional regulator n=1 Tax=Chitinophaga lutea TaxID=2488634 RepID=A0A3N4QEE7_9BACT|nr:substrate-binding domain-containing protein [Chitinophaga lutea]RPE14320.1 LacI family transcriptional regulator [Chitinophaga lutea]
MKRLSLKDVARMAGVAPSTVSFVLNGKARQMRISDELAEKVQAVVKKTGYQPHSVAVNLRTGQSKTLGLMVESISGSFFAALARVIESEADRFGYNIVYCSTENNAQKGSDLIRMLNRQQVDGFLITPAAGMEKDIEQLLAHKRPVVLMDSYFPGIQVPYVLIDNYGGVRQGMKHLLGKGYKKIGFITVDMDLVQIQQRLQGYKDALKEEGIAVRNKQVLKISYNSPREEAVRLIQEFIHANKGLDAIFFATNYLGILGLESIAGLGLRMPEDMAMICFDDHDIFRLYPPGITVVQQPVEEIAKTAINLLMQQLDKSPRSTRKSQVQVPGKFIKRGSA